MKPESYEYYSKTGLLLAVFDHNKESEFYYKKSRETFKIKEQEYWSKTDTLSIAFMLMNIGDIRSKQLIKSVIERKPNDSIYTQVLKEFNNYNHTEIVNQLKKIMAENKYYEQNENVKSKLIEIEN